MALDKATVEALAAWIVTTGLLAGSAPAQTDSGNRTLKVVDRTPVLIAQAGQSSACGKCATQGMCGESYMDRMRKKHRHAAVSKPAPQVSKKQNSKAAPGAGQPDPR